MRRNGLAGRPWRAVFATLVLAVVSIACSGATPAAPGDRAVELTTTGCGYATGRTGSGVAVGDGLIVTVAHLVVQADSIAATVGGVDRGSATVVGVDLQRDLAALRLSQAILPAVDTAPAAVGDTGTIVEGAATGSVAYEVRSAVEVSIEEVLGSERHKRLGYELEALTARGDSGAGAYDEAGRLIGVVFAYSTDPRVTWITASEEVIDFLTVAEATGNTFVCDAERSRIAPIGP